MVSYYLYRDVVDFFIGSTCSDLNEIWSPLLMGLLFKELGPVSLNIVAPLDQKP